MIVRVVQLIKNFYRDAETDKDVIQKVQWSTLGYFDGMLTHRINGVVGKTDEVWNELYAYMVKSLNGQSNRRNILCFIEEEEKDKSFWSDKNQCALMLISLVRLRNEDKGNTQDLCMKINDLNSKNDKCIIYYSNDHCEIIVMNKIYSYGEAVACIEQIHENFKVFKIYSIFSINEDVVGVEGQTGKYIDEKERINCRFNISVNWDLIDKSRNGTWAKGKLQANIKEYLEVLRNCLHIEKLEQFKVYNKMGNIDIVVEVENVLLYDLLSCYKNGEVLTHANDDYDKRWLNLETELLPQKEVI